MSFQFSFVNQETKKINVFVTDILIRNFHQITLLITLLIANEQIQFSPMGDNCFTLHVQVVFSEAIIRTVPYIMEQDGYNLVRHAESVSVDVSLWNFPGITSKNHFLCNPFAEHHVISGSGCGLVEQSKAKYP